MNAPLIFPRKAADAPIRFSPSVERLDPDEAATIKGLIATMRYVNERTFADARHAIRSVHAKTQGILEGYLEVDAGLPIELAQGLFAKPGRYPVVMRFSTVPGDILDESVSTPRGLAVLIRGVEGERLSGSEGDVTQDFVLVNGPAFGAPTPKKFLPVITLLSKTTNRV
ncbi:MAG: catalase, partial [Rhizomicrobium sp.]